MSDYRTIEIRVDVMPCDVTAFESFRRRLSELLREYDDDLAIIAWGITDPKATVDGEVVQSGQTTVDSA